MSNLLLDARLSQASYDAAYRNGSGGASIGGWQPIKVGEYRPITANFSAQLFRGADGSYKLAFRGTADPVGAADTAMNAAIATGVWAPEMTDAIRFTYAAIKQIQIQTLRPELDFDQARALLSVTGHSQGGFEAELAAKFFGLRGSSLDGPGAWDKSVVLPLPRKPVSKVTGMRASVVIACGSGRKKRGQGPRRKETTISV